MYSSNFIVYFRLSGEGIPMNILNENEAMLILKVNGYKINNLSSGLTELNSEKVTIAHKFYIYYYITKMLTGLCNNYFCNLYQFSVVIVRFLSVKRRKLFEEYRKMIINFFCGAKTDGMPQIEDSKALKFKLDYSGLDFMLNALNKLNVYYNVNYLPFRKFKNKIILIH